MIAAANNLVVRWVAAAGVLLEMACAPNEQRPATITQTAAFTYDHGGITRGDRSRPELALVFTADEHGEGTEHVLDVLARRRVKASFFLTGNYLRDERYRGFVPRMVREGHYVGPHSDAHLLYAPWEERGRSLVSRAEFERDLRRNLEALRRLGALQEVPSHGLEAHATGHGRDGRATNGGDAADAGDRSHDGHDTGGRAADGRAADAPIYFFMPPYEWYNREHAAWARAMGVQIVNFTPGIGSNRDYMNESDPRFRSSQQIFDDILAFERRDPHGLNGAILLLHLGADRRDKMYRLLDPLIGELTRRGYRLRRIDELLALPWPQTATRPRE